MFSLYFRNLILVFIGLFLLQSMVFGGGQDDQEEQYKQKQIIKKWENLDKSLQIGQELNTSAEQCAPGGIDVGMLIYGHRGGSFSAPENTRSSIVEAFQLGATGVEFDLQMTKDNEIIILHDETLKRTAAPYDVYVTPKLTMEEYENILRTPVQELTFNQIKDVDVGLWKDPRWKGEKVITLKEALDILPKGKEYLVEVKGDDFAIIPHLKKVLRESNVPASSIKLIGFGLDVMAKIKEELPEYKAFYITEYDQVATTEKMNQEIAKAMKANMDGMDFEARENITKEVVDSIKQQGKSVIVWVPGGVNALDSAENADRMKESGVDIFTSNLPPEIIRWNDRPSTF